MDHLKEVLGFLARWCVLAIACLSLLGVVWLALAAGNGVVQQPPRVIVSDAMVRQAPAAGMFGTYQPAAGAASSDVMAGLPGKQFHLGLGEWPHVYLPISDIESGSHAVSIRGLPYSPLEFCTADPRLLVLPPGMPGLLIDYRLAIAADAQRRQLLKDIITRLSHKRGVAFVHSGPAIAAAKDKADLLRLGFDQPLIWHSPIEANWVFGVQSVQQSLGARPVDLIVVTADISLAESLTQRGFAVDLIAATAGSISGRNLRHWPSLEQYAKTVE